MALPKRNLFMRSPPFGEGFEDKAAGDEYLTGLLRRGTNDELAQESAAVPPVLQRAKTDLQRGYLPVPTYSAHWIEHAGLRRAVAGFLNQERPAMLAEMEALALASPFRRDGQED